MKNEHKNEKNVYVTIILTESATSLLSLSVPHIEKLCPSNSRICLISPSEYTAKIDNIETKRNCKLNKRKDNDNEPIFLKISSEVGLFSTSTCSSTSCLSCLSNDMSSEEPVRTNTQIFEATRVHPLPLASARSMAHSNKLSAHSNNVYVSLIDSDSLASSDHVCRICHGGESFADLLTPCRCRGTIALVHLKCLERWLKESNHSSCELCQHHFKIIREPKYSIPWSVLVFLRHPGDHLKDILMDLIAFALYTPSAIASTYMLMMICEQLVKANVISSGTFSSHLIAFSAVFGMAAIDFTYSSWLLVTFQKHIEAWRDWYKSTSNLKVVLPKIKLRPHKRKNKNKKA